MNIIQNHLQNPDRHGNLKLKGFILALFLPAAMLFALSVGSAGIGMGKSLNILLTHVPVIHRLIPAGDFSSMQDYILTQVRLPRVLTAGLVGACLSVTGAAYQGLFRNPIAEPHIIGVSSGAALGATIAIIGGLSFSAAGLGAISICAFLGAIGTIVLVVFASGMNRGRSAITVLLTGTAVSTLFSAFMSLLMSLNRQSMERVYLWTFGSFSSSGWTKAGWAAGIALAGTLILIFLAGDLNLMAMGEDTAKSVGVETVRTRTILLFTTAFMVGISVSVSGMIGFVGLVVPHCMRFLFGDDFRRLIPASFLGGAAFLILCDTLARTILSPGEMPIGVITALVGAPYFIWLIKKHTK